MDGKTRTATCTDCHVLACRDREKAFPAGCLTAGLDPELLARSLDCYRGQDIDARVGRAAAEVVAQSRGTFTRVQEIIAFARSFGAKKIGLAACMALIREAQCFARLVRDAGLVPYGVVCKIGATDKSVVGYPDRFKTSGQGYEGLCNPALQATLLNREKTDLNVVIGLCVGHDTIFFRHSEAPVTTLVTKDRALQHNPVLALHGASDASR